jgi:hypothetical protein
MGRDQGIRAGARGRASSAPRDGKPVETLLEADDDEERGAWSFSPLWRALGGAGSIRRSPCGKPSPPSASRRGTGVAASRV